MSILEKIRKAMFETFRNCIRINDFTAYTELWDTIRGMTDIGVINYDDYMNLKDYDEIIREQTHYGTK